MRLLSVPKPQNTKGVYHQDSQPGTQQAENYSSPRYCLAVDQVFFHCYPVIETLQNSWLQCIMRDTVGGPDSIYTKDLMEKTYQLPISIMIKERRSRWLGHAARRD